MRLSSEDVAAMNAAAMLFPNHLPAPKGDPAASLRPRPIPAEGLALVAELESLAMDHAAIAGAHAGPCFATDVEDSTLLEQTARAMTVQCVAALGAVTDATPAWIVALLRQGSDRLARYATLDADQRLRLRAVDARSVPNGIDL